jgi:putative flavoprotein involved in K+ transport
VARVSGVRNGLPVIENEPIPDVKNVIWCTGFYPSFSWIDIPVFNNNEPIQNRGAVEKEPGLYFTGLHFQYSLSSGMIHGVKRDARYVVKVILHRLKSDLQKSAPDIRAEKQKPAMKVA